MALEHDENKALVILGMSIALATFMLLLTLLKLFGKYFQNNYDFNLLDWAPEIPAHEDPEPEEDAPENAAPEIAIPENVALQPQEVKHRNTFHVNCPVCLESIEQRTKKTKAFSVLEPCRHVFCHDCIARWFRENDEQRCPLCTRVHTRVVRSKKPTIWLNTTNCLC